MTGVVEKIKDKVDQVVHPDRHQTHTGHTSTNAGPHSSNAANKLDPRVDSDRDGSRNAGAASYGPGAHHTGNTGLTGTTGSTNAGPHNSNVANKLDPRVDSDRDGSRNAGAAAYGPGAHHTGNTGLTGTAGSTNAGPHDTNVGNKLDPRVDSDRDGSRNAGAATYGPGGSHNTHGLGGGVASGSTNYGPHDSNLANKLDPRVDSDRDGSRNAGAASYGPGSHHTGSSGLTGTTGSSNAGPHSSNIANKLDPRVDSDRDGSTNFGAASHGPGAHHTSAGYGSTGVGSGSANYGPHDTNVGNKLDPRVDSDRDGSRNAGAASYGPGAHHSGAVGSTGFGSGSAGIGSGTGPAPTTAGPHKSNLANKLDPRVDSDLDGSRTVGQGGPVGGRGY